MLLAVVTQGIWPGPSKILEDVHKDVQKGEEKLQRAVIAGVSPLLPIQSPPVMYPLRLILPFFLFLSWAQRRLMPPRGEFLRLALGFLRWQPSLSGIVWRALIAASHHVGHQRTMTMT